MDKFLIFTIVGLSLAAIYAVVSSGLVLTYATTGIFNFAHGAIGMLAAFAYWQTRFDWGWPAPLALLVVLGVVAPAFGLLLERVLMRGLQGTSEATRLVVSISLLVGLIGLANYIWEPGVARPMTQFFEGQVIDLGVTTITYHQATTIVVAVLVAVGLRLLLHRTRVGVAMRANVDDRSLSLLNGARPDRVALLSWALGSTLAAIGGILIAPTVALDPVILSLLIVSAYAAAIFGRLRSLPLTFVGAIVLGLLEGYLFGYLPSGNDYLVGLRPAAAGILLFVVLLALPNPRLRGRVRTREFFPTPTRTGGALFAGLVVAGGIVLATTLAAPDLITYSRVFAIGIIALSLVPLVGFAGQISLAQLSFAGIGGVVMAQVGADGNPLGLVLAIVIPAAVGAIVALPALRLSGIYLALGTAAFAVVLDRWLFNLPDFNIGPIDISVFGLGSAAVDPVEAFGYRFDTPRSQLVLATVAFVAVAVLVMAIRRSGFGRRLLAIRDSEAACATFGMNLVTTRLAIFTLSAGIAGFGGAIYSTQLGSITPETFSLFAGLPIFMMAVVGGIGVVGGALFAGVALFGILPLISTLVPALTRVQTIFPALLGIGLGRNPNGATHDMSVGFGPLRYDTRVLAATLATMAGWWVLTLLGVIGNWPFVILLLVTLVAGNLIAQRRASMPEQAEAEEPVPLEWVGIEVPWTAEHVTAMDRALGDGEVSRAPARG